ncbi:G-protein coupled receptor Mth [Sergentomyia squamirostris]
MKGGTLATVLTLLLLQWNQVWSQEYDYEQLTPIPEYSVRFCLQKNESSAYPDIMSMNMTYDNGTIEPDVNIKDTFEIVYGAPNCQMYELMPEESQEEEYFLWENGSIGTDGSGTFNLSSYCIYPAFDENGTTVLVCIPEENEPKFLYYPIGMLLSVPFLVITFLVYAIIPELRNLHGKSLMCYVFGLTVGYVFLSVIHLQVPLSPFGCVFMGFTAYFSFLTSFFWLNVMCIDIWWAFRGSRVTRGIPKNEERKQFLIYSIYAWGCSLTILSITIAMQFSEAIPEHHRPGIGVETCWIKGRKINEFFYLYFPVIILISINVILFTLTSIQIRRMQKEAAVMNKGDSRRFNKMEADRDRFSLYLRLFIVMGVTWIMEVISWLVDPRSAIFYISDIGNCLQGFFIFILFVWKLKIKKLIVRRYRSVRGLTNSRITMTSASSSKMSQSTHSSAV